MNGTAEIVVEQLTRARRTLRVAMVTETYPPDANEVALTAARLVEGLRQRGHDIQLVRPRRHRSDGASAAQNLEEVLTRGMPIPSRPDLKLGLPATRVLARLWSRARPDVVYVLTQGPLGWSALRAARQLRVPAVSGLHAGFGGGAGWLSGPLLAYLRKFHNRALWTLVPDSVLCAELAALGFRNLRTVVKSAGGGPRDPAVRELETLLEIAASIADLSSRGNAVRLVSAPQG